MTAGSQARREGAPGTQNLAAALRSSASATAERVGGGMVLIFAGAPGDPSIENSARLRAAAGFPMAESAREAAEILLHSVHDVISSGSEQTLEPVASLGERGAGGLLVVPLVFEGTCRGALAVGAPAAINEEMHGIVARESERLALLLDHAHLRTELQDTLVRLEEAEKSGGPADSEEVLQLSEALFAQDIELLRSNEKLGKIEKLKNDFIEKMSRELRTPLNSIIEAIISVLTGENETLSDGSKASLRSALDDGTEFLRTLQNILDLWRIKQRELPVEIQDVNFPDVVEEAIFSIQDSISDKPLSIEQRIEEPFPKIRTDLAKINQILFLLLENAVKFTARGRVVISAKLENNMLECQVQDTGIGICADDQPYIFDEFFQVDESSSRSYAGAGLGLALVRDLVVLMEGEVSIQSEVGNGTTVTFRLPIQAA